MGTKIHRRLGRHTIFINHLINPSPKQSGRGVSLPFPADKQRLRELTALGAVTQRCPGPPPSPRWSCCLQLDLADSLSGCGRRGNNGTQSISQGQ